MTSYPALVGYAPSYSWIGAPTTFNGTDPLSGGDSGKQKAGLNTCSAYRHCYTLNPVNQNIFTPYPHISPTNPYLPPELPPCDRETRLGASSSNTNESQTDWMRSGRESEPMVRPRRPSLPHRGFGHGGGHDTRPGLPLLRPSTKKIGFDDDMGLHGKLLRHHVPMVFLGLLSRLFSAGHERLHW